MCSMSPRVSDVRTITFEPTHHTFLLNTPNRTFHDVRYICANLDNAIIPKWATQRLLVPR